MFKRVSILCLLLLLLSCQHQNDEPKENSGLFTRHIQIDGQDRRYAPILFMIGTDDNNMPYDGGYIGNPPNPEHGSVISATETIDYWINFNQTDTNPAYEVFPDLDPNDYFLAHAKKSMYF